MACRQVGTKPSSDPMSSYCESVPKNADVVCKIAPTCPGGVKIDWYDMLFSIAMMYQNSHFGRYFMSRSRYLLADWQAYGMFKVSHSLINCYVNTCWVDLCLHKLFGGTLQFDTHQPKLPPPLDGTPKSDIMQGCDHTIQVIYSLTSAK